MASYPAEIYKVFLVGLFGYALNSQPHQPLAGLIDSSIATALRWCHRGHDFVSRSGSDQLPEGLIAQLFF